MVRAAILPVIFFAGYAIAAPPSHDKPPWVLAQLGNSSFRQFDGVNALTYSPDSKHIASADGETVHIWNASDGRRVRSIAIKDHKHFALRYTSDGRTLLAAGLDDRSTRLIKIDPSTGKVRSNVAIRAGRSDGIFSDDGDWLAIHPVIEPAPFRPRDPRESLFHVVNIATGSDWTVMIEDGMVHSFAFKKDGSAIVVGDNGNEMRVFESRSGRLLFKRSLEGTPIDLAFSPDGATIVAGLRDRSENRMVRIDLATGKQIWSQSVGGVFRTRFVEGGKRVLHFGMDANRATLFVGIGSMHRPASRRVKY